jgi:hypothetical protein
MIKENSIYDFHTHSIYSDGSDTPNEIIQKAKKKGIDTLALTDHDTIDGLKEASAEAVRLNINFINGIELSTRYDDNRLIHILGLDIDIANPDFQSKYTKFKKYREEALPIVIDKLQRKGLPLHINDLEDYRTGDYLDRQTIAKWLVNKNYASTIPRAWIDILDDIAYIPNEIIHVQDAFEMIHAGNGKTFIAHIHKPIGLHGYSDEETLLRLHQLKLQGLDGIEAFYPTYSDKDKTFIQNATLALDLLQSGGSDYHGKNRPEIQLGQLL